MQRRQKPRTNEKQELQRKLAILMVRWRAKCTIGCQAAWKCKPSGLGPRIGVEIFIVLLMYC